MSNDFSIKNQTNTCNAVVTKEAEDVNRISKHLLKGNSSVSQTMDLFDILNESLSSKSKKRTQEDVDKAINIIISGTELTIDEARKILDTHAIYGGKSILDVDASTFVKVLISLKYSIQDCTTDGKLNKEKLNNIFGCYVLMSTKADKQEVDFNKIREGMNTSLIQLLIKSNSELAKKRKITAEDVKDIIKKFIKEHFSKEKIAEFKKQPKEVSNIMKSLFGAGLAKCTSEEKGVLFKGFLLAIKDEDMIDFSSDLIGMMCNSFKDDKNKFDTFINEDLPKILKEYLQLDDATIDKLMQIGIIKSITPDNIDDILKNLLDFIRNLDAQELDMLKSVLEAKTNNKEFTDEQKEFVKKYRAQIYSLNGSILQALNYNFISADFNNLQQELKNKGLDALVYKNVLSLYEENPNVFSNITSRDDLIKRFNEFTDNEFSKIIGDTNPDNISAKTESKSTSDVGLVQPASQETYSSALQNIETLKAQYIQEEQTNNNYIVEKNPQPKEQPADKNVSKTQAVKSLESFNEALAQGLVKIDDAAKEFNNACKSVQLKVLSYLQTQKNNQLDLINKWHNSKLASVAANRFNFNKEQIEDLQLSIGRKQVMINNYEQKHKNDDEVA